MRNMQRRAVPRATKLLESRMEDLRLMFWRYSTGTMNTRKEMLPQLANRETVFSDQEGKTRSTMSTTGPQVFHTVHWNKARKEKVKRMYHLLLYTLVSSPINKLLSLILSSFLRSSLSTPQQQSLSLGATLSEQLPCLECL